MPGDRASENLIDSHLKPAEESDEFVRFLQGAAYAGFQAPVNATAEMIKAASGEKVSPPRLISARPVYERDDGWWNAGAVVGSVAQFLALSKLTRAALVKTGLVHPATPLTAVEASISGALSSMLRPLEDQGFERFDEMAPGDFWRLKKRDAITSAVAFGAMTRTNNIFHDIGIAGRIGRRSLLGNITINGFSGGVGGVAHVLADEFQSGQPTRDAWGTIKEYAMFGAVFGAAETGVLRAGASIRGLREGRDSRMHYEQFIVKSPSAEAVESPILSWVAESKPNLRPPNYEQWRNQIATSPSGRTGDFKLADWPREQRPEVLQEVRRLTRGSQLAGDATIESLIARLPEKELKAFDAAMRAPEAQAVYRQWTDASKQLDDYIAADPSLREMRMKRIVTDGELHSSYPPLKGMLQQVEAAEKEYAKLLGNVSKTSGVEEALKRNLNGFVHDAGLPPLKSVELQPDNLGAAYMPITRGLALGDDALLGGKTPNVTESTLHELVHHEQGLGLGTGGGLQLHHRAQRHIQQELDLLQRPGGTFDLLLRLGDRSTNTHRYLAAGGGLPRDIEPLARYATQGKIDRASWREAEISGMLEKHLQSQLTYHRVTAHEKYMSYVGHPVEQPAWAVGYLARVRAGEVGLSDPLPRTGSGTKISEYKPQDEGGLFDWILAPG